ncbi:hypothetical protein PAPYR_9259 [Paratrimastix pyriformis]|uniref:Uncharacterized protein n=1 Tax=Paratrimastix pyriformis TaxID=342808 RepID=A0ABQ8UEF6_9EUKA|nr:hypothetical protein PAPYR_9259 [Paratrimastix pyriformis]
MGRQLVIAATQRSMEASSSAAAPTALDGAPYTTPIQVLRHLLDILHIDQHIPPAQPSESAAGGAPAAAGGFLGQVVQGVIGELAGMVPAVPRVDGLAAPEGAWVEEALAKLNLLPPSSSSSAPTAAPATEDEHDEDSTTVPSPIRSHLQLLLLILNNMPHARNVAAAQGLAGLLARVVQCGLTAIGWYRRAVEDGVARVMRGEESLAPTTTTTPVPPVIARLAALAARPARVTAACLGPALLLQALLLDPVHLHGQAPSVQKLAGGLKDGAAEGLLAAELLSSEERRCCLQLGLGLLRAHVDYPTLACLAEAPTAATISPATGRLRGLLWAHVMPALVQRPLAPVVLQSLVTLLGSLTADYALAEMFGQEGGLDLLLRLPASAVLSAGTLLAGSAVVLRHALETPASVEERMLFAIRTVRRYM